MIESKSFARGAIRAVVTGPTTVRIEGPVTMRKGKTGLSIHPSTARALAQWLLQAHEGRKPCP